MRNVPPRLRDRLQFSGHETFPLRQLWLKKAHDAVHSSKGRTEEAEALFADDRAIARFGVGKNMVSAIRHWALACEIIEEADDGGYAITKTGKLLFGRGGCDPHVERPATPWLMHWMLAGRGARSTTWFWVFNLVNSGSFRRDALKAELLQFAVESGKKRISPTTVESDINVCIRCYLPSVANGSDEDAIEPLLAELGLLSTHARDVYEFRRGPKSTLPDGLFAFALADYWSTWNEANRVAQTTLSFEAIAHDFGSPGRVFKLDENSVSERLARIEDASSGRLRWSDSAGVRQVVRSEDALSDEALHDYIKAAYE
ncbi:MAG: DUF4007 family protein [Burkholderiales bacterium]|nr:DUF4007 family protein [Burkholderiales bacterium]